VVKYFQSNGENGRSLAFLRPDSKNCLLFMKEILCWWLVLVASVSLYSSASADISIASCEAAQKYSAARRGLSLLVLQDDRIIYEAYSNGFGPDRVTSIYSGTKGFWCAAAAAAEEDGILDLDDPVKNTITEWQDQPDKANIRIQDLLHFTAGIEPVFALHGKTISDRNAYSIRRPAVRSPGQSFMYGPSQLQIFCEVLRRKLLARRLTPRTYLSRRILRPLGIGEVDFREDSAGNPLLASGFKLTARQWSALGLLVLHKGKYGRRQLVSSDSISECWRGTRANPMFGMGFWLNRTAGDPSAREVDVEKMLDVPWQREDWQHDCLCKEAPRDLIAAIGSAYQRMFIIPSLDLIIVRQGRDASFSDARFLRLILGKDQSQREIAHSSSTKSSS
jgi:CubicO group peptidase (beta-lactamase class C family)